MSNKYIDKLHNGKLVLLTRNGSKTIYCRYRIEGRRDYVYKTTKTDDLVIARSVADDIYGEVKYRQKHNMPINNLPFQKLFNEWYETTKPFLSIARQKLIEGTAKRYLIPYFNNVKATELNDRKIEEYWTFRLNYYTTGIGVAKIKAAKNSRVSKTKKYKNKLGNVANVKGGVKTGHRAA